MGKPGTQRDIADAIAKKHGLKPGEARAITNDVFDEVGNQVAKRGAFRSKLGSWKVKTKPAQKGGKKAINPFTKEEYITKPKPAQKKVRFSAGKALKELLGGKRK